MGSRRSFIRQVSGAFAFAAVSKNIPSVYEKRKGKTKLRIAIASDGHYGQPGTDYAKTHTNIIQWLNKEHHDNHLDFIIFNGDLVHNEAKLLNELKSNYLSKLTVPYYAVPGNHDRATTEQWVDYFGYEDNFSIEKNDCVFVFANTSNVAGEYVCPDNAFLKAQFEKNRKARMIFVVLHIPPHVWVPEQTSFTECGETLKLLHGYKNIRAVFHGHDHNLDTAWYTGNDLPHLFDSHYGGDWGTDYYGYRILEVDEQNKIHTYQVNASASPILNSIHF